MTSRWIAVSHMSNHYQLLLPFLRLEGSHILQDPLVTQDPIDPRCQRPIEYNDFQSMCEVLKYTLPTEDDAQRPAAQ